jgi:hypothetical protein
MAQRDTHRHLAVGFGVRWPKTGCDTEISEGEFHG